MKKTVWLWVAAVIITLAAIVFQRKTGPTYPKKVQMQLDTVAVELKLPRSHNTDSVLSIAIPMLSWDWTARLYHRPYPTQTDWLVEPFSPKGNSLSHISPLYRKKRPNWNISSSCQILPRGKSLKFPTMTQL